MFSLCCFRFFFFFFNDTATTEIYTLSLHDALPISSWSRTERCVSRRAPAVSSPAKRSEEHTSELQSQSNLVCRLLLEKKKKNDRSCAGPWRRGAESRDPLGSRDADVRSPFDDRRCCSLQDGLAGADHRLFFF